MENKTNNLNIKRINSFNREIIFDVYSGRGFFPNEVENEIAGYMETMQRKEIEEKLSGKYSKEILTEALDKLEQYLTLKKDNKELIINYDSSMYTLILHPSRKCNLACKYCFGNQDYLSNEEIDLTTAKQSIEHMVYKLAPNCSKYTVDLSGSGEPLMRIEFIKEIYNYCTELSAKIGKEILIMFATNGTLLTKENIEYLSKTDILYGISVDGHKEIHDSLRIYHNNKPTFDDVVANAKEINNKKHMGLALTVTGKHTDIMRNFMELYNLNVADSISMKPVRGKNDTEFGINENNIEDIKKGYSELAEFILDEALKGESDYIYSLIRGSDYFGKFIKRVIRGGKTVRRCDAGLSRNSVNSKGELYMCQVKIGDENFKIGDIYNGIDKAKYEYIKGINVDKVDKCRDCWAKYVCGGECFAVAQDQNNDFETPDAIMCSLKQHLIELSLYIVNMLLEKKNELYIELYVFVSRQDVYGGSDSGAYSLKQMAEHFGKKASIAEIRKKAQINEYGIVPANLLKTAKELGLELKAAKAKKEHLKEGMTYPFIAHFASGYGSFANYYNYVRRIEEDIVETVDPIQGEQKYTVDEFCSLWSGLAFVV